MHKYVPLILIAILTLSSLIIIKPATSQITKPSIPEFTVQLTVHSSNTPTTYSTDPYTGKSVTHSGSHSEWTTLDITIKNQPFTHFFANGGNNGLLYNIRFKGHYEEVWSELCSAPRGFLSQDADSDYTVLSFAATKDYAYLTTGNFGVKVYGQVDFQIKAMIGFILIQRDLSGAGYDNYTFIGEESGWSDTQMIAFGNDVFTPTPTMPPTPSASVSSPQNAISASNQSDSQAIAFLGLDWLQVTTVALLGTIAVLLVFVVVFLRKRGA